MTIHSYPTGEACWTWRVPEKWTCSEAYLETLDGRRLLDYRDHPLHVVSYSLPFEGVVSRDELLRHLHVHPRLPEAIPFVFKYYERDWGLCASQSCGMRWMRRRTGWSSVPSFEPGTLKVGEVVIPGESQDCFVLVAHLCHPAMVNDDLTGVVVGLEVARSLLAGPQPYYTYRLLILPETIGSVAYLSHHEDLIPDMRPGCSWRCWATTRRTPCRARSSRTARPTCCLTAGLPGPGSARLPGRLPHGHRQRRAPVQRPRRARAHALPLPRRAARVHPLDPLPGIPFQPGYPCHRHRRAAGGFQAGRLGLAAGLGA